MCLGITERVSVFVTVHGEKSELVFFMLFICLFLHSYNNIV